MIIQRIHDWWQRRHSMYILVREDTSEVIISKALFDSIRREHPGDEHFRVLFSRSRFCTMLSKKQAVTYCMFINPQWEKHGISNPNLILTSPITIGKNDHIGFHTVQPTVAEILAVYGIDHDPDKFVRVNIARAVINEEPYYQLQRP